jgi:beta-glucanase (GH16 family)
MNKLKLIYLFLIILFSLWSCNRHIETRPKDSLWRLVWSDEFEYNGVPDPQKWDYDTGNGCPELCGWGNNELQYYTRDSLKNARVENGKLIIEVQNEKIGSNEFSSARLVTRGKKDWKYGKFVIRAKLPASRGVWSALWMMPSDTSIYGSWPKCGEIDIMENVGFDPDTVEASAHTGSYYFTVGTQKHRRIAVPDANQVFHNYILEWEENEYRVYVDERHYFTFVNEGTGYMEWPFDQQFYLILNIAYGGNWGGARGLDIDHLPQKMEVDYVRVYEEIKYD